MGWEFFNVRKIKKGRKAYQCSECLAEIPEGSEHLYCSGTHEGDFDTYRCHEECDKASLALAAKGFSGWINDNSHPFLWDVDFDEESANWLKAHHPIAAERIADRLPVGV